MSTHDNPVRDLTERYRLGRVLEATSSSTVYRATTKRRSGPVVVKVIAREALPPERDWHAQFEPAMFAVRRLGLRVFPDIIEAGWLSDREGYVVMSVVEGIRLDVAPRPATPLLLVILARLAAALHALHEVGTAHLNVSPRNVLLADQGGETTGVLLGLGTGWLRPSSVDREFAAPEFGEDAGTLEPRRCDVFSFALTLCRTLGIPTPPESGEQRLLRLPQTIEALVDEPVAFRRFLERSMFAPPNARPESLNEIAAALRRTAIALRQSELPGGGTARIPLLEPDVASTADPDDTAKIRVTAMLRPRAPDDGTEAAAPGAAIDPEGPLDDTIHIDAPSLQVALERHRRAHRDSADQAPADRPSVISLPAGRGTGSQPDTELDRTVRVSLPSMAGAGLPRQEAAATSSPSGQAESPAPHPRQSVPGDAAAFRPLVRPAPTPWSRRPLIWGIGASISLAAALVLLMLLGTSHEPLRRERTLRATASAPARTPAPPAPEPTPDRLGEAESAFANGDFSRAEEILDGVSRGEPGELSRYDQERMASLHRSLAERHQWDNIRELDGALVAADLSRLRRSVETFASGQPAAADNSVEVQRKLALARDLVDHYDRLLDAERHGGWAEVIESAEAILAALPKCEPAVEARERAATELEIEADTLARNGDPAAAIEKLEPLRRWWPERSELDTRIASFKRRRDENDLVQEAVRRAEEQGREGRPDAGLELLAGLAPEPKLAGTVSLLRERLQADLDRLDAGSPVLSPMPGTAEEYDKDQPIRILLHVEDDYRVATVTVYARSEGAASFTRFVAAPSGGATYAANIPPEFHRNRTVQYYVVATDSSEHRGELGSAARPLEIKRKHWRLFHR
jgi:serine/threonine protein kinase